MSCEQFDRRIARYLIELGVVRRMLGKCKVSDLVESLVEELRGIR